MNSFAFGDTPQMADELLGLVLSGKKTATSWAASLGLQGEIVGEQSTILDSAGKPRAIIEVTEIIRSHFHAVKASIAHDEGEGDLSLDYWRKAHEEYFKREGTWTQGMDVYSMRFKLVKVL